MPTLGETVGRLGRMRREMAAADVGKVAPQGAMQEVRGFGFNPGALRMLVHLPADLPPGAPLVVVLHGCTQGAEAHAAAAGWLALADRLGFAVLGPEQTPANNANRCFNWFEPGDIGRDQGEAASIHAMVAYVLRRHGLDPQRVFVTGLSAGGAMTAVMLATYPEVFAGGAVIAGLPYGAARNVQQALSLMHGGQRSATDELAAHVRNAAPNLGAPPRLAVWHGDADWTVNHANGADVARQWAVAQGLGAEPDQVERLQGRVRQTWRSAAGDEVVELNLVHGLGHGTPLATKGEDGVGYAAPYMLEAGVSSSLEVARFWGLVPPAAQTLAPALGEAFAEPSPAAFPGPGLGPSPSPKLGDNVMSAIGGHVSADVQAVIARALKGAGLMS